MNRKTKILILISILLSGWIGSFSLVSAAVPESLMYRVCDYKGETTNGAYKSKAVTLKGTPGSRTVEEKECPLTTALVADESFCIRCNECTFCSFYKLMVNVGRIVFYLAGVAVLLSLVVGAFFWVTSAGSSEKVTKGKKIITTAFIGLVIIMLAYEIVGLVLSSLISGSATENVTGGKVGSSTIGWYDFNQLIVECEKGLRAACELRK